MPILQWLDRDKTIKQTGRAPYRLLEADTKLSYGDKDSQNLLIQGDNLEALKALLPYYAGKVKCIYIDPPYNTGSAFEHYDDSLEHTKWLEMMYPRLELLHQMLSEDGFFACHIDDAEGPYLKVILDEIFGRTNYETTFYIQVRYLNKTLKLDMAYHKQIEQVHIYKKSRLAKAVKPREDGNFDKFNIKIETEVEPHKTIILGGKKVDLFLPSQYKIIKNDQGSRDGLKEIWATGSILDGNSSGRFFRDYLTGRYKEDGLGVIYKVYGIGDDQYDYRYFTGPKKDGATKGKYYQGVPIEKLDGSIKEYPIHNFYDFADRFGNCRHEGNVDFRSGKKPEHFIQLILSRFSNEKDLILDSFSGSGSTIATALKMNRRFIGIEMGEHAKTHCTVRLQKVIDGEQGGISKDINWQGGGGFRFYHLGEAIFDEDGQINKNIRFEHLAAHIWFSETKTPLQNNSGQKEKSPLLGVHNGTAYYLLFNGILGDKSVSGGNVLTAKTFASLPKFNGPKVIYGETSRLGFSKLEENQITFKQTPYDIKAR